MSSINDDKYIYEPLFEFEDGSESNDDTELASIILENTQDELKRLISNKNGYIIFGVLLLFGGLGLFFLTPFLDHGMSMNSQ